MPNKWMIKDRKFSLFFREKDWAWLPNADHATHYPTKEDAQKVVDAHGLTGVKVGKYIEDYLEEKK